MFIPAARVSVPCRCCRSRCCCRPRAARTGVLRGCGQPGGLCPLEQHHRPAYCQPGAAADRSSWPRSATGARPTLPPRLISPPVLTGYPTASGRNGPHPHRGLLLGSAPHRLPGSPRRPAGRCRRPLPRWPPASPRPPAHRVSAALAVPEATPESGPAAEPAPPAEETRAITVAHVTDEEGYGVQLGAFVSQASADRGGGGQELHRAWRVSGLMAVVASNKGDNSTAAGLASGEAQARALCDVLKGQSQACVPVLPP